MNSKKRFYQIDFLRFIAAIGILLAHYLWRGYKADNLTDLSFLELAGTWVKYMGAFVDLFFIISGFVISLSIKKTSLSNFIQSRVVRLFSVYWMCACITYIVTILFGAPRFTISFTEFLFNLTMLQDFFNVPRLDGAYWTMSVELRFYFLTCCYLFLQKIKKVSLTKVAYVWLAISAIYPFMQHNIMFKIMNLFLLLDFSPAFIGGMLLAKLYEEQKVDFASGFSLFTCFCLSTYHKILFAKKVEIVYQETFSVSLIAILMFVIYTVMLLIVFGRLKWLNKPQFLTLGIMTYPLYLLHQRIGYIIFNNLMGHVNKYVILGGTIVVMITLSFVIVKYLAKPVGDILEKRFTQLFWNSSKSRLALTEKITKFLS